MFCKNCGKTLNKEEMFCANCGTKVENYTKTIINNVDISQSISNTNYNINQQPINTTQHSNQYVNNINNDKKDNKTNLILGIILTVIGIGITIGTFFFFGPFLGFMFLIPGTILLFGSIFSKSKKSTKILLNIILTIVVCVIVIAISVLTWQNNNEENNIDNNIDNSNQNIIEENTNQEENIKNDKRVGSDEFGYITIPKNWATFIDLDGNSTLQYSYANIYIATLYAVPTTQIDAYNYASSIMSQLQSEGAKNIQGATVNVGKYTAYQVYGYYANENIWLVCWLFEAEDGKTHYISIEGPDPNSEYFNIPNTFSITK